MPRFEVVNLQILQLAGWLVVCPITFNKEESDVSLIFYEQELAALVTGGIDRNLMVDLVPGRSVGTNKRLVR